MILNAYSLFDVKTGYYHAPMFFRADGEALRAIENVANDMSTLIGRYPTDYHLFRIGTFDDQTGVMVTDVFVAMGPVASLVRHQPLPMDAGWSPTGPASKAAEHAPQPNGEAL